MTAVPQRPRQSAAKRSAHMCVQALCFGYFHLGQQMKVTRPPGRDPARPRRDNHPRRKRATSTPSGCDASSMLRPEIRGSNCRARLHHIRRTLDQLRPELHHDDPIDKTHHEVHVVLDQQDRQPLAPQLPQHIGQRPASPCGASRPPARRAATGSGRRTARGRSPSAAAGRAPGCRRARASTRPCRCGRAGLGFAHQAALLGAVEAQQRRREAATGRAGARRARRSRAPSCRRSS